MEAKTKQLQIRLTPREKARLKRLAVQAGQDVSAYVLARVLPAARVRFGDLVAQLEDGGQQRYVLAELNDLLAELAGPELSGAVEHGELARLSALQRNYVAALVEHACHRRGVSPPAWTSEIEPLEVPYFAVPFPSLRLHLLRTSPVPYKRRNIFVNAALGDRV